MSRDNSTKRDKPYFVRDTGVDMMPPEDEELTEELNPQLSVPVVLRGPFGLDAYNAAEMGCHQPTDEELEAAEKKLK